MSEKYKRVNVLIRPDQYQRVHEEQLSLSGLVRDLLDDRFSETKIVLSMSKKSKKLYDLIISNFGRSDAELERYIIKALDGFLEDRKGDIERLRKELKSAS